MRISAVICTSNRPAGLARLLQALLSQQRLPDQVVIVEDRQGPEPQQILKALRDQGSDVCYLRRSPPGLTASRNLALKHADGELLSFFDDDTVPAADYLQMVEQVFAADAKGRLGGLAAVLEPWDHRPGMGDRLWQMLMRLAGLWSLPYRRRREIFGPAVRSRFALFHAAFLPGVVTYRRSALNGLRFDETLVGYGLGEDLDISFSLPSRWQLYRCALLRIRHQRDSQQRLDHLALGKMFTCHLAHITCKHSGLRIGTLVVLAWQLIGLCCAHLLFVFLGNRRTHAAALSGILRALPQAGRNLRTAFLPLARPLRFSSASTRAKSPTQPPGHRRRHILFVLNTLALGGAERLMLALLEHLDPTSVRSSLLCLQQPGPLADRLPSQVAFYHNFSSGKYGPLILPAMLQLIIDRRVDLVVSVGNGGDRMFWSSLACLLTGRPLAVWCHSQPTPLAPSFERVNRLLRTVTHSFVAVSAGQAQALAQILHIPKSRITLIENALPNFSKIPLKKPTAQQRTRFRRQFNLPAKAFLIATVGNLRPVKGHDVLVDAAAEVLRQNDKVYFLLIGDGPQRQSICERIARRRIDDKHILLLGQHPEVADLLRHCDLFVSPSHNESFGLAVLEAMAVGLPVIATDSAGPRSLIEHGHNGLLTPVGHPHQLAQAITNLIDQPDLRSSLAAQARRSARQERFHISTMVGAFERFFELLT